MSLIVRPAAGMPGAESVDRGQAIRSIIRNREAPKAEESAPESKELPPKAEELPPKPDLEREVERERREREMDKLKHEIALRDAELERHRASQADGKDWKKLLATHGHSVEQIVQEWLGEDSSKPAAAKTPERAPDESRSEYATRLEQLERRLAEEDNRKRRESRLAEIKGLATGDDYEVTSAMDWHEMLLSQLDHISQLEKRQIGPQETQKLLQDFEKNSRAQLEKDVDRLAKTKFGRSLLTKLLQASKESTASETTEANETHSSPAEPDAGTPERAFRLSRLSNSEQREQVKRKILSRLK